MRNAGFTLLELILIIVIISILAAAGIMLTEKSVNRAKLAATEKEMASLVFGLIGNSQIKGKGIRTDFGYVGDCGSLPTNGQGLDALVSDPGVDGWNGPYISGNFHDSDEFKRDEWENGYIYNASAGTITSYGSDGVEGGTGYAGDITKKILDNISYATTNSVKVFVYDARNTVLTDEHVEAVIDYQGASGVNLDYTSGYFYINGSVPMGKQNLTIVPKVDYVDYLDPSIVKDIIVYPRGPSFPEVSSVYFPGALPEL